MRNHKKLIMLLVDPTVGFCEAGDNQPEGGLPVAGARESMNRLAGVIEKLGDDIDQIVSLIDMHPRDHISMSPFWVKSDGSRIVPFVDFADPVTGITTITHDLFSSGEVFPINGRTPKKNPTDLDTDYEWVDFYLQELERLGRFQCQIWPTHQVVMTQDVVYHAHIGQAIEAWEVRTGKAHKVFPKGDFRLCEAYSGIQAEVPHPGVPSTGLRTNLISVINRPDTQTIAGGIAGSHCIRFTGIDLMDNFGKENLKNVAFIEDCSPAVPGCESQKEEFFNTLRANGCETPNAIDI